MLEHIFRNLNDIRLFDAISEYDKNSALDFEEVMDIMILPDRERIQIEDSIKHLVEQEIIGIKLYPDAGFTGCQECADSDACNITRKEGHESHTPLRVEKFNIEKYYLLDNDLTKLLSSAVLKNSFMYAERESKKENHENSI